MTWSKAPAETKDESAAIPPKATLPEQPTNDKLPSDSTKPKVKRSTVNDRMKAEMASNLETVKGWTAKRWAEHLNCGQTTVKETETWKSLSLLRQQAKAEKRKDRRRR